jgi:hypothetical protein
MYNALGEETEDAKEMVGKPTNFKLMHPENVLFVDETGCNTNMKGDGHVGGELFVLPVDALDCGVDGIVTDIHFLVLCFTSGIGDPVMCAVILKSKKDIKDIPITWRMGIDIRKDLVQNENKIEFMKQNVGPNSSMPGGPTCTYLGKEVPCFVGASPNASITSEMLAAMLGLMDELQIFDRSNSMKPFLLLDGHHSRTRLPFLRYINDDAHPWTVCIGVPYGTHLWQVADAPQLNGSFKINLTKAKREYIKYKELNNRKFCPSDCIPLINMAWYNSFANVEYAKKAIRERGWGPLNYVLLDHPKLIPLAKWSPPKNISDVDVDINRNDNDNTVIVSNGDTYNNNNTNTTPRVLFDDDIRTPVNNNQHPSIDNNNGDTNNGAVLEIEETEGGIGIVEAARMKAVVDSINKTGRAYCGYVDFMMEGEALAGGRKRKYDQQQKDKAEKKTF